MNQLQFYFCLFGFIWWRYHQIKNTEKEVLFKIQLLFMLLARKRGWEGVIVLEWHSPVKCSNSNHAPLSHPQSPSRCWRGEVEAQQVKTTG